MNRESNIKILKCLSLIFCLCNMAWTAAAQELTQPSFDEATTGPEPQILVSNIAKDLIDKLTKALPTRNKASKALIELMEQLVGPHLAYKRMARLAMGKYWPTLTTTQKDLYLNEFKILLIHLYVSAFSNYTDQQFKVISSQYAKDKKKAMVRAHVIQQGLPPLNASLFLSQSQSGWKLYDVKVEGIGLLRNIKSQFVSLMQQGGFSVLMAKLRSHNKKDAASYKVLPGSKPNG